MTIENDDNIFDNILLLGAGFSKNFGAPLANEMWYLIFNHKEIQAHSRIRELMLNNFDYEFIYDSVLEGFTDKEGLFGKRYSFIRFTDEEKSAIRKATNFAYEHINKIFTQFMEYLKNHEKEDTRQKQILEGVSQFLSLFYQIYDYILTADGDLIMTSDGDYLVTLGKSFIFTLNQDSFFENCYNKFCTKNGYPEVCIPGTKKKQDDSNLFELPSKEELQDKDILSKGSFFLIKLHGSNNWQGIDGNRAMVIGKNKEDQISKEPLLSHYFDIFKEELSQKQRRLLIIGYSFSDDHINKVISDAVKNYGLKIYILSPGSIEKLKERLSKNYDNFIDIYNGIAGYFPYTEILTGDPILDEPIQDYFKETFFNTELNNI